MKKTILQNKKQSWAKSCLALLMGVLSMGVANATTYYSEGNLAPNTLANWNSNRDGTSGSTPGSFATSGDIFIIQGTGGGAGAPHTMTSGSTMTFGAGVTLEVESGATLQQNSNITFNATATFRLKSGATFNHNSSNATSIVAGIEDWQTGSTVVLMNSSIFSNANVTGGYPNLTFNNPTATINAQSTVTQINGNLTVTGGAGNKFLRFAGNTGNVTVTVGGDVIINGSGTGGLDLTSATTSAGAVTLNVGGSLSISATNLTVSGNSSFGLSSINFTGGSASTSFTQTGGTVTSTLINWSVANSPSGKTVTLNNALTVATSRTMTVATGATLATAATLTSTGTTTINGTFQLNSGGSISAAPTYSGTGSLVYNSGGSYGNSNEWTGSGTTVGSGVPYNVTVQNNTTTNVTASRGLANTLTVANGSTLTTTATISASSGSGGASISGTFQINQGGYAQGGTWNYNSAGTLAWNNSSGLYGPVNTHDYLNNLYNVQVLGVGGVDFGSATKTIGGLFTTQAYSQGICNLTFNGGVSLNSGYSFGGSCGAGLPAYGCSSTLTYNSGGSPTRGIEWGTGNTPGNVTVSNNTTLNGNIGAAAICGTLTINSGSSLYMDFGGGGSGALTVGSNVVLAGNLSLGGSAGGDLNVAGNWTHTTGTFTHNSRSISFNGTTAQLITATGGESFGFLTISNTSNTVTAANNIAVANVLQSNTSSILDMGTNALSGAFTNSGTGTIKTQNTGATPLPTGKTWTQTIEYNSASAQTIVDGTYATLTASIGGTKTAGGAIVCNGTLTVASGSTLDMVTNTLTGSYTNSGTGTIKTQNTGGTPLPTGKTWTQTIEYNASGNQTAVVGTYAGLTCSGSGTKTMAGDFSTSGTLTLNGAKLAINGNTLTLNGTVSGMSASNSLVGSSSSKLNIGSTSSVGTVFFDQTTSADVTTTTGTNALQNLVVSGSGGSVTLGNKVNLFDRLSVSAGTLNTGDVLVLRSTSSNTSYVDNVGGTISGEATVERYMHKQQRGWRILTAPVTYNGISQGYIAGNWQSNFGYGSNYGTRISGPSATNGIDDATTGSSLQKYNSTTGAWSKVTNTNTETQSGNSGNGDNKGFYMFIRGDRTVTPAGSTPNAFVTTTLAAKGKLQTGTQTLTFTGTANKSWLIGNPFACPVDMEAVTYNNIGNFVYVWDLNLAGSSANTTGNYATFDRTSWGSGPSAGSSTKYFQSGQGFFVVPDNATASLVFEEADKSTSTNNNTAITGAANNATDVFNIKLVHVKADGTKIETDGVRAKYGANYSNDVDANDAIKWSTTGIENIALLRNAKSLAIESRPYITDVDYLNINLTGLSVGANYEFKIKPINFDATVSSCKLIDNFLNTETTISLTAETTVGFNITSVAGSSAADRFKVVFNGAGSLPINSVNVKAYKQNNSVVVDWEAIAENNVKLYTIEKSVDGANFSKLNNTDAKNGNTTNKYSIVDNAPVNGNNYYRVKTTQSNDKAFYSNILVVNLKPQTTASFNIYPNPVKGNTIGLQFNNMEAGKYTARLFNVSGQEIWANTLVHNGNAGSTNLRLSNALLSGTYQLTLTDAKGNSSHQTVVVE